MKGDGDIVVDAIVDQVCNKHTDCESWITLIYGVGFYSNRLPYPSELNQKSH